MPVVTIARQLGSLGDEIGETLATRLGFRYLDHHLLPSYVRDFGEVEPNAPEIAETRPSFWERLNEERRRHAIMVRSGVYRFARDNDAVIVGLGANVLLGGLSHVLRVLTVAAITPRVERIMQKGTVGNPKPLAREEAIEELSRATTRFAAYQRKWMRRIPGIVMIDGERPAGEVADAILEVARAR